MHTFIKNSLFFFIIISLTISVISCSDDDPVAPQEEHFEAIGTVIYDATGAITITILRGVTSDTLYVEEGALSDHFDVKFYDENENIVDPPLSEEHSLGYEIANEDIVEWWQHEGEEGDFEFHLRGIEHGTTTLELFIQHSGHNDYRSGNIPVKVMHGEHEGEPPVGLVLYYEEDTTTPLVTVEEDGSVSGSLSVNVGESSEHTVVYFLNDEGEEFQPNADEHIFEITVVSGSDNFTYEVEEDEPWTFFITGVQSGTAEITITLKEKHDDHYDTVYTSPNIPIIIN